MLAAMVGYGFIGWTMYDFDSPDYEEEERGVRIIDEMEFEGIRYWTQITTWRFTGYEPGTISNCFGGNQTAYRVYHRIEPVFRPIAWIARRCKGHAFRAESQQDQADDPKVRFCSRSYRWEVLEP